MKIENILSAKGNKIANQFKITTKDKIFFQSYNSVVASISKRGHIELYKDWNYSNTTRKYLYRFLSSVCCRNDLYNKKAVENAIKDGMVKYIEESPSL